MASSGAAVLLGFGIRIIALVDVISDMQRGVLQACQVLEGGCLGRNRAGRSAASSIPMLLATMFLPIASTAASYIMRAQHIALKFDGELFRLYVISAHASAPRRIIRSTHLVRISPILSPH
jgi:hypothetical protein